jgi:hypothetical protein
MFNWKGDVAWINNSPNEPAMDVLTGGLLIVGVAAWIARMLRRRDAMDWLILPMIFIMMLPSALSIAYPIENPSATRMSGTLPGVYLLAALPLALIVRGLNRLAGRIGLLLGVVTVGALVGFAYTTNAATYFEDYRVMYVISSLPYSEGGRVLREFVDEGNPYGNTFIIAYPHWWDHRAVGIEAGRINYPNTIRRLEDAPGFVAGALTRPDAYRLDPNRDLLFFYATQDTAAEAWLMQAFPNGNAQLYETYQPGDAFMVYRVPALGEAGFAEFVERSQPDTDE